MQNESATSPRRDFFPALATGFFALPNLIFLLGWVRPEIGIPVALLVTAGVVWFAVQKNDFSPRPALTLNSFLLALTVASLWALLAGVGGVLPQSSDYIKHNLLSHDLVTSSWPVNYSSTGHDTYLCYALGYYLVPALAGKFCGMDAVTWVTFFWTFTGLFLFFWWAVTLTDSPRTTVAAILLFASTGIFWALFKRHGIPGLVTTTGLEPKLLDGGLLYSESDSFTRFLYGPQHALTGWLGAALLFDRLWTQKNPRGAIFIWTLCVLWSPLTSLGLLLVPLAALGRADWKKYFEPLNFLALPLLAVLGVYFQGHLPLPDKGFIGKILPGAECILYYTLFVLLLFTPLLFLWLVEQKEKILGEWRPLFFCSSATLLLLPLWRFGLAGDLREQAGGPALLFLALAAAKILQSDKFSLKKPLCLLLGGSLLAGALIPVARPLQNLTANSTDYSYANIAQFIGWRSLPDMTDLRFDIAAQYQGSNDSFAVRRLLKKNKGAAP
jgi:hypothetical protein